MLTVGIDIGGTFTDLVLIDHESGEQFIGKTLTTPKDPSIGSVQGLADLLAANGRGAQQITKIIHGTTLVANSLIERKGAKTARNFFCFYGNPPALREQHPQIFNIDGLVKGHLRTTLSILG